MPFKSFAQIQPRMAPRNNGQCTHLTMTRLYTNDFRCVVCAQLSGIGWLYRCTQDRELILEDEFERGDETSNLDDLSKAFERPLTPRKRGPAARASITSFFDETNEAGLKTYTDDQITQICEQRVHILNVAAQESQVGSLAPESIFSKFPFNRSSSSLSQASSPSQSNTASTKSSKKHWVPAKGTECQFKCCWRCRPTLADRAFLSLDGVTNNDTPLTAITGFGFHLRRSRPVGLVKHVKNIGLRPSPPPHAHSPARRWYNPAMGMGLGLFDSNAIPIVPRPLPEPPISSSSSPSVSNDDLDIADYYTTDPAATTAPPGWQALTRAEFQELTFHAFQYNASHPPASNYSSPLSPADMASLTPLPPPTPTELATLDPPPTPMEEIEAADGEFGSEPLEVSKGIAVTEEAVGFHLADLIM